LESAYGQVSDLEIQATEIGRVRTTMEEILAKHTGQSVKQIRADVERDKIFTAEEAVKYGIIDGIMPYRKLSSVK